MQIGDLVKVWRGRYPHERRGDDFRTGLIVGEQWFMPPDCEDRFAESFVPVIVDGSRKDIDPRYIEALNESR
jgi:hypothetical protein